MFNDLLENEQKNEKSASSMTARPKTAS